VTPLLVGMECLAECCPWQIPAACAGLSAGGWGWGEGRQPLVMACSAGQGWAARAQRGGGAGGRDFTSCSVQSRHPPVARDGGV
jgi:hypothetical protein